MKKIIPLFLALAVTLVLSSISSFAATSAIPDTIKNTETGGAYTASYNSQNKILTYQSSGKLNSEGSLMDGNYGGAVGAGLVYKNNVSPKTQNEILAYNDEAVYMSMSDIAQSGKVKTIQIEDNEVTENGDQSTTIFEYTFTRNNKGQVTSCECGGDCLLNGESAGWVPSGRSYEFTYDNKGDLKSISREGRMMPYTTTTFNFSNGKLSKLVDKDYDGEVTSSEKVSTDSAGRPTKANNYKFTYDANGHLTSVTSEYSKTQLTYNANGNLESAQYSYTEANKVYTSPVDSYTYKTL